MKLNGLNISTYTLDGDNIRLGISKDLTFSQKDRTENIRRIAEIGNLFVNAGVVTLACFVSPYIKDRDNIKKIVGDDNYIEIFVSTSLYECEIRDTKGIYKKSKKRRNHEYDRISAPI